MHGRSLARWALVAILATASVACQLASRERRMPRRRAPQPTGAPAYETIPPATARAPEVPAPGIRPAEPAPDVPPAAPGEAVAQAEPPADVQAPVVPAEPAPVPAVEAAPQQNVYDSHCVEPPERAEARERMRRGAEEHEQLAARLRELRAELEVHARSVAEGLPLERIQGIAAELADRAAQVPGVPTLEAELLASSLHEAAFWGALCRALVSGPEACARLEAGDPGNGACCRSVRRLAGLARERPSGPSLLSAIGSFFGWTWEQQQDERIWQVVFDHEGGGACEQLASWESPERWYRPLCRALAAGDPERCSTIAEAWRGRACAALVRAILRTGADDGEPPTAAAALLREAISPTGTGISCAEFVPRVVVEAIDTLRVFDPAPPAFPHMELVRGLAPAP